MAIKLFLLLVCVIFSYSLQFAQPDSLTHEISGEVKELSDFHEVIYPMWHTAYPDKDVNALRGFVPEINKLADNIFAAQLPGILRDKQEKWKAGIAELKTVVDEYNIAAKGVDDAALLNAAENLHAKYEMMVRLIRPVLPEVEEFHKVLYVVYHKDLPNKNYSAIKSVTKEFVAKAEAITNAKLSKRLENRTENFKKAAANLLAASIGLEKICKTEKNEMILSSVEKLHANYQALEKVFD
ncbi:MAG: hypothetical protein NTX22_15685 [Ignavibacteriales bacterium]|nr:hypothetical protein [Ignavibacteriales bacterium]